MRRTEAISSYNGDHGASSDRPPASKRGGDSGRGYIVHCIERGAGATPDATVARIQPVAAAIRRWRLQQALGRTWLRRPELLERRGMNGEERQLLEEFKMERAARASGNRP